MSANKVNEALNKKANPGTSEQPTFLEAAVFFIVGIAPPFLEIDEGGNTSSDRLGGSYERSATDPCVFYWIGRGRFYRIRVDFNKLPSPRTFQVFSRYLSYPAGPQLEARFTFPAEAWCSRHFDAAGKMIDEMKCLTGYGISAKTVDHLRRRLDALDYIRANFCPGLPEPPPPPPRAY
jgi:hypothetical protein